MNDETFNKFQKLTKEFKRGNVILIHNKNDLIEEFDENKFKKIKKSENIQQIETCLKDPEDAQKIIEMILKISQKMKFTQKIRTKDRINVVLLGSGEVGKTTILKRIKKMYKQEYSSDDLKNYQHAAEINVLYNLKKLFELLILEGWEPEDPKFVQEIVGIELSRLIDEFTIFVEFKNQIQDMYRNDEIFQNAILHHHKYLLYEGFPYLMDHLDEILNKDIEKKLNKCEDLILRYFIEIH
jgi:hypothetical protein